MKALSRLCGPVLGVILVACGEREAGSPPEIPLSDLDRWCEAAAVRDVVVAFGRELRQVPLLAVDSILEPAMREAYAPYVTPGLLDRWMGDPSGAPGREVSSPWPERIEIDTIAPAGEGICSVKGDVVYVTSTEVAPGPGAVREPVTLEVTGEGGDWRISDYLGQSISADPTAGTAAAAAGTIRDYYSAIDAGDFATAYQLWGDGGAASGQTLEAFTAGFAETASVEATVGEPGRIEAAAGSRYVEVPVTVRATTTADAEQRFEGTYTLRLSVVDGATPEQRSWRIYSAEVRQLR